MISKIKKMTGSDWIALFKIAFSFVPALFLHKKQIWLFSERPSDARDNAFWMFKFVRENHPEINAFYAIDFNSNDYKKVAKIGNVIKFGSFKHHMYTWGCKNFLSAHIGDGFPNKHVCFNLLTMGFYKFNNIFLQHGITCNKPDYLFEDKNRIHLFCCANEREREFVATELGYGKVAKALGFCRYDNLDNSLLKKSQLLIMPTWRYWLAEVDEKEFLQSEYYACYNELLAKTKELCDKYEIIFYLHNDLQQFSHLFKHDHVIVASKQEFDVQNLLKESSFLVTDYSSVFFDFAYMEKPLIYFQFDSKKYRKDQYEEGYFSYLNDGFGPICTDATQAIDYICENQNIQQIYQKRIQEFFVFRDKDNCFRTYEAICSLGGGK